MILMRPDETWCGVSCIRDKKDCFFQYMCPVYLDICASLIAKQKAARKRFVKARGCHGSRWNPSIIPIEELMGLLRVYIKTGLVCWYCGKKMQIGKDAPVSNDDAITLDHRVPLAKGGGNTIENVVFCCSECNTSKGDRDYPIIETEQEYANRMLAKIEMKYGRRECGRS